ncbi:hypothetical protein EG347_21095 [Chryseobacterium sp. G0186]|nr:hypothetical protein EG347_21095 [Chryseobacterium sp. G0186]
MILISYIFINNFKIIGVLLFILISVFFNAQKIKIWNNKLKNNILVHQKVSDDSTYLSINKKENKWLGKSVNIKTFNYWHNASIDISVDCCKKNILIIKRTFLGNTIVGDKLYFKKKNKKYYFENLKEFEQRSE